MKADQPLGHRLHDPGVAATGIFHATLREFAKLHGNLEMAKRNLHDTREKENSSATSSKVSNSCSEKAKAVSQASRRTEIRRKRRDKQNSANLPKKLETYQILRNFIFLFFSAIIDNHGNHLFKVRPNVFQLNLERLEVRGPTTLRPAWS